jgi:hypothetical protein
VIDLLCSLIPSAETVVIEPPMFWDGPRLPQPTPSSVSTQSIGGFFMAWDAEKQRQCDRNWKARNKERRSRVNRAWRILNREKLREYQRTRREANKEINLFQQRARHKALYHISLRETCEWCRMNPAVNRHHPDHSKPLEVIHLCLSCHNQFHWKERKL